MNFTWLDGSTAFNLDVVVRVRYRHGVMSLENGALKQIAYGAPGDGLQKIIDDLKASKRWSPVTPQDGDELTIVNKGAVAFIRYQVDDGAGTKTGFLHSLEGALLGTVKKNLDALQDRSFAEAVKTTKNSGSAWEAEWFAPSDRSAGKAEKAGKTDPKKKAGE